MKTPAPKNGGFAGARALRATEAEPPSAGVVGLNIEPARDEIGAERLAGGSGATERDVRPLAGEEGVQRGDGEHDVPFGVVDTTNPTHVSTESQDL